MSEAAQQTRPKRTKKQWVLFITGLIAILTGVSILGFFGVRKIWRVWKKYKLIEENGCVQIAELDILAPVLEGTDQSVLRQAAGHFPGTGTPGSGNYCLAAHSSVLYKEYFNELKHAEIGMEILARDAEKHEYSYTVSEMFTVEPNEIWILGDFGDDRITLVTCTDDGSQRLIVVGKLNGDAEKPENSAAEGA